MSEELPEGWAWANLGDLGQWGSGGTPSKEKKEYWEGGTIPWVSAKDMKAEFLAGSIDRITEQGLSASRLTRLPVGSIIMVVRGMILARGFPVAVTTVPLTINQDLRSLVPGKAVQAEYLLRALQWITPAIFHATGEATHGTRRLESDTLKAWQIPIAPIDEQRRIVAAVERILAEVNAARERLARVPATLKRFRQSVLAAACSGQLTADWRPRRSDETAEGELPAGWERVPLRTVADVRGGIQKQPKRAPRSNHYPYLRVANVLRGRLDLSEVHRMELFDNELELYRLQRSDLLIVEGNGSLTEVGRCAIWSGDVVDCVHQNHIIRVRVTGADPAYISAYWNSPQGRDAASGAAVTTTGLHSLSVKKVNELPVTLPPLDEQREIVRRVSALFALADGIEAKLEAARKRVDALTQAVLAKAFRGELVPTEAELARREGRDYEPASVLLERIRAERVATEKPGRRRGRPDGSGRVQEKGPEGM